MQPPIISAESSIDYMKNYITFPDVKNLIDSQTVSLKSQNRTPNTTITNLYLCHITSFFPTDGIIYPRMKFSINLPDKVKQIIEKSISILRPTVHFTVNSIVSEHKDYKEKDKNTPQFIIIEKIGNVKGLSGGYLEDVFCIGKHELSQEAAILMPDCMKKNSEILEKIKTLDTRVTIIYYNETREKAFENFFKERKIELLSPIEENSDIPNYVCSYGKNQYVSSQSVMKLLGKTFCTHDISPTAQIENYITCNWGFSTTAPYSLIPHSDIEITKIIQEYVKANELVYKLSESQKDLMRMYQEATLLAVQSIKSSNLKSLGENFEFNEELVVNYDAKIDLKRKIESQGATAALKKITQLNFSPYNRKSCITLVDAAYLTNVSKIESEKILVDLKKKTGFKFILENHADDFYIVLKNVNVPHIHKEIWNSYLNLNCI